MNFPISLFPHSTHTGRIGGHSDCKAGILFIVRPDKENRPVYEVVRV